MGPNTSKPHLAEQMVCVGVVTHDVRPPAVILHVAVDVVLEEELVNARGDVVALQDLLNPGEFDRRRVHVHF